MSASDNEPLARPNDIAVIGLALRVPGARNVEEFWANLRAGREAVTFFTDEELRRAGVEAAKLANPRYVKANAVLADADRFDAEFFGYTPREAELLDVQQRVFLECAWTALEHAGYDPLAVPGACAVFAGAGLNTYLLRQLMQNPAAVESAGGFQVLIANDKDFLASRVSYKLNLRGPSVAVQSACSTSLVAIHLAVQSVLAGDCDVALAGGVSIRVPQTEGYLWQEGMILSPDGHCRPFSARGAGIIGGNGAGVVVLKRLEDALADGDTVHAVIRGSAVNNDGSAKLGYTAPSQEGQEAVIAEALAVAGVVADDIGYVEAHGTGTPLGDPIEVAALTRVFRRTTPRTQFCALGSVKSNLGHLDTAAGVVGFIKAVLAVKHGEIPPSLHGESPNPQIDFASSPFRVATELTAWPMAAEAPRRAGVSSFGIGGTNAHVILEQPPAMRVGPASEEDQLLIVSARTEAALRQSGAALAAAVSGGHLPLADVASTLALGRRAFAHRAYVVARDPADAAQQLRAVEPAVAGERMRQVAFLFPGQGTQYPGMGAGLYAAEPVFRTEVDRCLELLRPHVDFDLRALLLDRTGDARLLARTDVAQLALFVVSYALARLWEAWGVRPEAMLGHSIGEWTAACLAEVFTLEEALRLVAARGRLMAAQPAGAMLAVALGEADTRALLDDRFDVAAVNAAGQTVVSGTIAAMTALADTLAARGIGSTRLQTSHAYHSAMMEPAAQALMSAFHEVPRRAPTRRWISSTTGTWITPEQAADPGYWARHLRGTVRFADGLATLLTDPEIALLEVGAGRTLCGLAERHPARGTGRVMAHSLHGAREATTDETTMRHALGRLWVAGVPIAWAEVYREQKRRRVPLPTYPFAGERYWIEAQPSGARNVDVGGKRQDPADWFYVPGWRRGLALAALPPITGGEWALIPDASGLAERLAARLRGLGAAVRIGADPTKLLGARWIVSLRDVSAADASEPKLDELCALGRVLSSQALAETRLTVVATGLHAFPGENSAEPAKSLLLGAARVLPNEIAGMSVRVIDVARAELSAESLLDALIAEARGGEDEFVALRGRERWMQTLEPVRLEVGEAKPCRPGAVVVITGGFGGLGLALAESLFERARARLVLVGRSTAAAAAQQRIDALIARGAEVITAVADVTDESALQRVHAQIRSRFGGCQGVIHAAGVAGGGALARRDPVAAAAVRAAKVAGTLVVDRVFGAEALDFFVLMSSLTAQLGEFGQADYAAANAFLDAYATARRREGVPMVAIGWDAWRDVGMAARFEPQGALAAWQERQKELRLTNAEGAEVLVRAVAAGVPHVIVSTVDLAWRRRQTRAPKGTTSGATKDAVPARAAHPRPALPVTFAPPQTATQRKIAAVWEELLGVAPVGVNDDFFALGGHSLLASQAVARLRDAGVNGLTLATFFEAPTIVRLAATVAADSADEPALVPAARAGRLPLSFAQQALWLLDRMEGRSAHYNEFGAQRIRGPLEVARLRRALGMIVDRHEVLRTRFVEQDGEAAQVVDPPAALELPVEELPESRLAARAAEIAGEAFDLVRGPLLRARLVKLGPDDHVLMIAVHHIVFDGWSSAVFFREAMAAYAALARGADPALPALAVQYADYAVWQRRWLTGARREALAAFWKEQLAGPLPVLALPTDHPRPATAGHRGRRLPLEFGADLTSRLRARAQEQGASLFMLVLSGYGAVLGRTAAQEEVIVGCPMAGRERRELEPLIGFFINPLPIRISLAGAPRLTDVVERVRGRVVAGFAHAALPFEQMVTAVQPPRDPSRSAVFQTVLTFQNAAGVSGSAAGTSLQLEPWERDEVPVRTDLDFYCWETPDGLRGYFVYNVDLFTAATVQRLATRLRKVLETLAADPATRLAAVAFEAAALPALRPVRSTPTPNAPKLSVP
ncbi:type I polyketide synthase [Opitutus terrae]|uniref:Erythronolide synthase n=1 Tax=Opitutus terrae (strain DSM 11246 / JCM 15787 / PB90-1) TaxID=452637 RepID=B1ZYL3_OPITP|nr:type I polyketide synthase [Opitutus terrae]ACB75249.1 Erythronolide synthase [Opitutus terrae PB90-1]